MSSTRQPTARRSVQTERENEKQKRVFVNIYDELNSRIIDLQEVAEKIIN